MIKLIDTGPKPENDKKLPDIDDYVTFLGTISHIEGRKLWFKTAYTCVCLTPGYHGRTILSIDHNYTVRDFEEVDITITVERR